MKFAELHRFESLMGEHPVGAMGLMGALGLATCGGIYLLWCSGRHLTASKKKSDQMSGDKTIEPAEADKTGASWENEANSCDLPPGKFNWMWREIFAAISTIQSTLCAGFLTSGKKAITNQTENKDDKPQEQGCQSPTGMRQSATTTSLGESDMSQLCEGAETDEGDSGIADETQPNSNSASSDLSYHLDVMPLDLVSAHATNGSSSTASSAENLPVDVANCAGDTDSGSPIAASPTDKLSSASQSLGATAGATPQVPAINVSSCDNVDAVKGADDKVAVDTVEVKPSLGGADKTAIQNGVGSKILPASGNRFHLTTIEQASTSQPAVISAASNPSPKKVPKTKNPVKKFFNKITGKSKSCSKYHENGVVVKSESFGEHADKPSKRKDWSLKSVKRKFFKGKKDDNDTKYKK